MNTNKITITLSRPQSNAYPIDPAAHNHDVSDDAGYNPYGGILNPLPAIPAAGDRMEVGHITCVWKLNEDGTRPYGPPTFRQYHYMTWATVLIDQPRFRPDEPVRQAERPLHRRPGPDRRWREEVRQPVRPHGAGQVRDEAVLGTLIW